MTPRNVIRRGATLIELLVVMSVIAALGALALMLLPAIANSDNTLKGTAEVQSTLKIAQGMAGASRLPRGVRFVLQPGSTVCTEMQYLEAPPVMVPDPKVLVAKPSDPQGVNGPRVEFLYDINPVGTNPSGAVVNRHCRIFGLNPDQASQVTPGATLILPTLGSWSRINSALGSLPDPNEVILEVYPDAALGAGTSYRTYHFGVYGPPVPLVGEPTVPLPKDIGVDLAVSYPGAAPGQTYDILFAPSGQTLTTGNITGNTGVFLWVRDITRVPDMLPTSTAPVVYDPNKFLRGGEQQVIGIRNGFVGTAPILWPDQGTGTYAGGQNAFSLAQQQLN